MKIIFKKNGILLLTAIYLLWLLAVLFIFGYTPTNDGEGYIDYARQCLAEGQPYPTASIYRDELFVWNIGIINLTELSLLLFRSITPLLLLLCLMKAATALFMSLTANRLFGQKVAMAALLLFAVYPNNWGQSTMVSSEIPSTCLCMAALWAVVGHQRLFVAGLLLAVANWFRPTATIFICAILLFLLFQQRRAFFSKAAALLSGYALFIAVVGTSCLLRTGHFVYQSRSYWFSMVDECYDGASVAPHWNQPFWPEGTPRYIAPEQREQMDCFDYERIWRQRSLDYLKDHKLAYLSKVPGRLYYMYQSDYDYMTTFLSNKSQAENNFITLPVRHLLSEARTLNAAQWLSLACWLFYLILLSMAFAATIRLIKSRCFPELLLPLSIVVGGSLLLALVMHGETRFKDPLMPCLFMLAAAWFSVEHKKT